MTEDTEVHKIKVFRLSQHRYFQGCIMYISGMHYTILGNQQYYLYLLFSFIREICYGLLFDNLL